MPTFSWENLGIADGGNADTNGSGVDITDTVGNTTVGVTITNEANSPNNSDSAIISNETLYNTGDGSDTNSSIELFAGNNSTSSDSFTMTLDFADDGGGNTSGEVENVSFTIFDVDQEDDQFVDHIIITAVDANGVSQTITLTDYGAGTNVDTTNGTTAVAIGTIDATGNEADAPGGAVTITIPGPLVSITIDYNNTDPANDQQRINVGDIEFDEMAPPCFVRGTLIETKSGPKPVELLAIGDEVLTQSHGYQEIRWIGSRKAPDHTQFAPIVIKKGALGNTRDLCVSPQHRMVIEGWRAELLFGESSVLVPAKHLRNGDTIFSECMDDVEYFHILFDQHEIIFAEGAPTESYHPGMATMNSFDENAKDEILSLFPELEADRSTYGPTAQRSLRKFEAKLI